MIWTRANDASPRDVLLHRYLFGECMVMASTLSRLHDLPMIGVHDDMWMTVPRHVGVLSGPSTYGDARGLHQGREKFLTCYGSPGTTIRPVTMADLRRIWGTRIVDWDVPFEHLEMLGLTQRSLAA